jgi:riboflavin synthase
VDTTGKVKSIEDRAGSYYVTIGYHAPWVTVPQGSITVNGISLTVAHSGDNEFSVALIPYTWEETNMKNLKINDVVNLEFDIIGKYIAKLVGKQYVD